MENVEIAVRCFVENEHERTSDNYLKSPVESVELNRILVFDTETRTNQYQNLTFGSFRIYEHGELKHLGLFYGEYLTDDEMSILTGYASGHDITIMPVREFVERVFYPEVHEARTLCVGFNLPFDLSRLALSWGPGRGKNRDAFNFKLSNDLQWPRLRIQHLDSKRAFIQFANGFSGLRGNARYKIGRPSTFRGHFLDLRSLAFALTNDSHSLESAGKHFRADIGKTHPKDHGIITPDYIDYNINDVRATYSLYLKMIEEYEKYHLDKSPTHLYSPASIGKAYLDMMGVQSFLERNPDFPKEILGYLMTTYFGGRSEVRVRKEPMQVNLIDFLSMYPTMCILQGLWRFVIADRVDRVEDTETVRQFVDNLSIEALSSPDTWTNLTAIVQIIPNEDILPARSKYGDKHTYNIGLTHLSDDGSVWYTLADVVASKILTGRTPNIVRAIRFIPRDVQDGLRPVQIIGDRTVDPVKTDFFKALMEYRHDVKTAMKKTRTEGNQSEAERLDTLQKTIKVITNSTSYGIFVEINTSHKDDTEVMVYGNGPEPFMNTKDKVEQLGRAFNPILATFSTASARLVLALTEAILLRHGSMYAFCDTDSMAVPPEYVNDVQDYFQKLSPYSFDDPLFKLEDENFGDDGRTFEPLWFYGISAKRYVLYNIRDGIPHIRKHSLHGLGHILNPFDKSTDDDWHKKIWLDILNLQYGLVSHEEIDDKYTGIYAVSKMAITSPHILQRFTVMNEGQPIHRQIKPFNFMLVGISNATGPDGHQSVKPITPYSKAPQRAVYGDFIDYQSGTVMNGIEYWKPLDALFWDYLRHKETKFEGDRGILQRRHLKVGTVIHIGKESEGLEETEILGVRDGDYQVYLDDKAKVKRETVHRNAILSMTQKDARKIGISRRTMYRWKKKAVTQFTQSCKHA